MCIGWRNVCMCVGWCGGGVVVVQCVYVCRVVGL